MSASATQGGHNNDSTKTQSTAKIYPKKATKTHEKVKLTYLDIKIKGNLFSASAF